MARAQARLRPTVARNKLVRAARRASRLIYKNQFSWAANLAGSLGIGDATPDTLHALPSLFPEPLVISEEDLHDYYGHVAPPLPDVEPVRITLEILRTCLADAPPLSSPHKDGWRTEHLSQPAPDVACGPCYKQHTRLCLRQDLSPSLLGYSRRLTQERRLDYGCNEASPRACLLATTTTSWHGFHFQEARLQLRVCALHPIRGAMGPAVRPAQFSVETKGGCDLVQWAL